MAEAVKIPDEIGVRLPEGVITKEQLSELKKKRQYLEKIQRDNLIYEFKPGSFIYPNPKQQALIDAWNIPMYKVFCMAMSNQVGKTTIAVVIGFSVMFGEWPWSGEKIIFPHDEPRIVVYTGQQWLAHIQKVVEPELMKWWPRHRGAINSITRKNNDGIRAYWKDPVTQSELFVCSNYQDVITFEGFKADLCIEENQQILMADGSWTPIKNIIPGDKVWTISDGNQRSVQKVKNVFNNGMKKTVKVSLVGGAEIICTPDHKIYCAGKGRGNISVKEARDLSPLDKVYCPVIKSGGVEGDPTKWFIIGYWLGDGWCDQKRVFIATANEENRLYLENALPDGQFLIHRKRYDYEIQPSNSMIYRWLRDLNLQDKKAATKFIPQEVFCLNDECKIEFLKGLFCTDGWLTIEGIGFGVTSKKLSYDLFKLLRSIGIQSTVHKKNSQKKGKWNDQWFLNINKSGAVLRFHEYIGNIPGKVFSLAVESAKKRYLVGIQRCKFAIGAARKDFKSKDKAYLRSIQYCRVKSITENGEVPVYDLSVEKNHNFICEGIKVHNCIWDEPPKRENRVAASRGLMARSGRELFVATLLSEAWMGREIVKKRKEDGSTDHSIFVLTGEIWENVSRCRCGEFIQRIEKIRDRTYAICKKCGPVIDYDKRGLTVEGVENYSSKLRGSERISRLTGKPAYLGLLVLPNFDRSLHSRPRHKIPMNVVVDISIDFHPSKPWAVLFCYTDQRQFKWFFDFMHQKGSPRAIAEEIIRRAQAAKYHVNSIEIDPLAKGDENVHDAPDVTTTFTTMYEVFASCGYILETASKDKDNGVQMLNDLLMTENEIPGCFIFDDMGTVLDQCEDWMLDPDTLKPSKKDPDEFCELGYRIALRNTQWYDASNLEVSSVDKDDKYDPLGRD